MDEEPISHQQTECILCHQNHRDLINHPWGIISLLQKTSLPTLTEMTKEERTDRESSKTETFFSSCGHTMHLNCYDKHTQNVIEKAAHFEQFEGDYLDVISGYYVCPLCKNVSNTLVPVTHELNSNKVSSSYLELWSLQVTTEQISKPPKLVKSLEKLISSEIVRDMIEGFAFRVTSMNDSAE